MLNNLEEITFDEVKDKQGVTYLTFRKNLHPYYSKVFFDIGKGYFFLGLIIFLSIFFFAQFHSFWWLIVLISSILIGYTSAYLALFIHEAGHYNISSSKKNNDRIATILLCLPFGLAIESYRKIHWQHHLHLGTPNDTENSYFNALTKLFAVEMLTGIHLLRMAMRKKNMLPLTKEQTRQNRLMFMAGLIFHASIILIAFFSKNWPLAISWILGFVIFFPFFATIRQILEHRDELASHLNNYYKQPHGVVSRLFVHTLFSSSFGSAGFTRHMIHHWDPQISYTRLRDIEIFLTSCERTSLIIQSSKTTYTNAFKKLIATP